MSRIVQSNDLQFLHLFVSFVILCVLNCVVVQKLRSSHRRARRQSSCPTVLHTVSSCFCSIFVVCSWRKMEVCDSYPCKDSCKQYSPTQQGLAVFSSQTTVVMKGSDSITLSIFRFHGKHSSNQIAVVDICLTSCDFRRRQWCWRTITVPLLKPSTPPK